MFLFSAVEKNECYWFLIYLYIYLFIAFCFCFCFFSARDRIAKTQMMANYQELHLIFCEHFINFHVCFNHFHTFPHLYAVSFCETYTIQFWWWQISSYIKRSYVCVHMWFYFFLSLGLLFVHHFWLAIHSSQIHHPFLQFLKANWFIINLQGVCFVKSMFCMHRNQSHCGFCGTVIT